MDVRARPWRRLSTEELVLSNSGVGEDSWESLGLQESKPVNNKRKQSWIFIGKTNVKAEAPVLWPHDVKSQLTGKDPDAGKEWRQGENGMTKDEMIGWHHRLNGQEFGQTLGDGEGQGSLACCSLWGHKDSDTTEWLNSNKILLCLCLISTFSPEQTFWASKT